MAVYLYADYLKKTNPELFNELRQGSNNNIGLVNNILKTGKIPTSGDIGESGYFSGWDNKLRTLIEQKISSSGLDQKAILKNAMSNKTDETPVGNEDIDTLIREYSDFEEPSSPVNRDKVKSDLNTYYRDARGYSMPEADLNAFSDFVMQNGRLPNEAETKAGGNTNPFFYYKTTIPTFREKFDKLISDKFAKGDYKPDISTTYKKQADKIKLVQDQLSPYGMSLTIGDVNRILSSGEEDLDVVSDSIANTKKETAVTKNLSQVVPNELAAIKDWENTAVGNAKTEVEEATPYLYQSLNSRGLMDTGSLSTALAKEYNTRVLGVKEKAAGMGLESKMGGISKSYENTLRSALSSGASLSSAIATANAANQNNRNYEQDLAKIDLENKYANDRNMQSLQWQLANQKKTSSPSGLDYFLQYGLPTVTSALTGNPSTSLLSGWLANMAK